MFSQETNGPEIKIYGFGAQREPRNQPKWRSHWLKDGKSLRGLFRDIRYCSLFDNPRFSRLKTDHPGASIQLSLYAEKLAHIQLDMASRSSAMITTPEGATFWSTDRFGSPSSLIAHSVSLPALVAIGLEYDLRSLNTFSEMEIYQSLAYPVLAACSTEISIAMNGTAAEHAHNSLAALQQYFTDLLHREYDCFALIAGIVITSISTPESVPSEPVMN